MADKENEQQTDARSLQQPTPTLPRIYGIESNSPGKIEWPELLGVSAEEAERKIKEEMTGAQVQVVQPNCFVTMDYRTKRVRLYLDESGKISRVPRIG